MSEQEQMQGDAITTEADREYVQGFDAMAGQAAAVDGEALPQTEQVPEPETPTVSTGEILTGVLSPLCDIVAPNWKITRDEKQALGEAYGALVDKYWPEGIGDRFAPEITAITVTAMVVMSRKGTPMRDEKEVNPKDKKEADRDLSQSSDFGGEADTLQSGAELGEA